jgi:hypothetical protein
MDGLVGAAVVHEVGVLVAVESPRGDAYGARHRLLGDRGPSRTEGTNPSHLDAMDDELGHRHLVATRQGRHSVNT